MMVEFAYRRSTTTISSQISNLIVASVESRSSVPTVRFTVPRLQRLDLENLQRNGPKFSKISLFIVVLLLPPAACFSVTHPAPPLHSSAGAFSGSCPRSARFGRASSSASTREISLIHILRKSPAQPFALGMAPPFCRQSVSQFPLASGLVRFCKRANTSGSVRSIRSSFV